MAVGPRKVIRDRIQTHHLEGVVSKTRPLGLPVDLDCSKPLRKWRAFRYTATLVN
jgi:hypothetical protein